ncbi:outer membrane beta-barrel protein [Planctomycetota bacterium]
MKAIFGRLAVLILLILVIPTSSVTGTALMGTNYGDISYTRTDFGSNPQKEAYGEGDAFTGLVNLGSKAGMDFRLGVGYHWADGLYRGQHAESKIWKAEADFLFSLKPGEAVNPYFVMGFSLNYQDVDLVGYSFRDTDWGMKLGFGGEFELSPKILARAELDYLGIEGYDDIRLFGLLGYWFTDRILGRVSAGYEFDSYNALWSLGVAFPF